MEYVLITNRGILILDLQEIVLLYSLYKGFTKARAQWELLRTKTRVMVRPGAWYVPESVLKTESEILEESC